MTIARILGFCALLGWLASAGESASLAQSVDEADDTAEESAAESADVDDVEETDDDDEDDDVDQVIVDGVFTPSEKIEADSEISFPADI